MLDLWASVLSELREVLGEHNYLAWIDPVEAIPAEEELVLQVPSVFYQSWIERYFLREIREATERKLGRPCPIRFTLSQDRGAMRAQQTKRLVKPPEVDRPRAPRIGKLIPHYTFDSFVVGPSNEMAFRTACSVCERPGKTFNPVFLHGGVGLGKTHLINAIAHELLRRRGRTVVACLSAENFMNQLITALRQDQMPLFRERFRRVDALILDDIQFLSGKERTQEEFFHTFNALQSGDKQIVLTSDQPPSAIVGIEKRLRSRFEGGLIADIHPPTREMRVAIVHAKANRKGVELPPAVAEALVRRSGVSVRELEGALNRAIGMSDVRGVPLDLDVVNAALGPLEAHRPGVSVEVIQQTVSHRFGLQISDLTSRRRGRQISFPRQIAMYLSRTVAQASYPRIAQEFGNRDHTTVMYAVRTIEDRRAKDAAVDQVLVGIEAELRES
jgi:chromosomal replication initiator protein